MVSPLFEDDDLQRTMDLEATASRYAAPRKVDRDFPHLFEAVPCRAQSDGFVGQEVERCESFGLSTGQRRMHNHRADNCPVRPVPPGRRGRQFHSNAEALLLGRDEPVGVHGANDIAVRVEELEATFRHQLHAGKEASAVVASCADTPAALATMPAVNNSPSENRSRTRRWIPSLVATPKLISREFTALGNSGVSLIANPPTRGSRFLHLTCRPAGRPTRWIPAPGSRLHRCGGGTFLAGIALVVLSSACGSSTPRAGPGCVPRSPWRRQSPTSVPVTPALATREFRAVVKLDPNNKFAWFDLGVGAGTAGHVGEADRDYRRAIAIDPGSSPRFSNYGYDQYGSKHYAAAAPFLRRATEASPNDAGAHLYLGLSLAMQAGSNPTLGKEATDELELAVKLNPAFRKQLQQSILGFVPTQSGPAASTTTQSATPP